MSREWRYDPLMRDESYSPFAKAEPERPRPKGERAWTLRKWTETLVCGYLTMGGDDVEVQLYVGKEFLSGRLFRSRPEAERYAAEQKAKYVAQGWLT